MASMCLFADRSLRWYDASRCPSVAMKVRPLLLRVRKTPESSGLSSSLLVAKRVFFMAFCRVSEGIVRSISCCEKVKRLGKSSAFSQAILYCPLGVWSVMLYCLVSMWSDMGCWGRFLRVSLSMRAGTAMCWGCGLLLLLL